MKVFSSLALVLIVCACSQGADDLAEWQECKPLRLFQGAELYGHINGGSEIFLELGFDRLEVRNYGFQGKEIAVEIYWMSDPAAALGIYLMKCGRETPDPDFAERHTINPYQLFFCRGPAFVIVHNISAEEENRGYLLNFGRKTARDIPDFQPSKLFNPLPAAHRVPASERVIRGGFTLEALYAFGPGDMLQLEGTTTALAADYVSGPETIITWIQADYPDVNAADRAFRHLNDHLDQYLEKIDHSPTRLIFKDYNGEFGEVHLKDNRITIRIGLDHKPSGDPYADYLLHSRDFLPVKQDRDFALAAWPGWYYMPWTYQWPIGYNDEAARFCKEHGYNGAFLDHGGTEDKRAWIERHQLRFYVDHLAGKGDLHLFDGGKAGPYLEAIHSPGPRHRPLNQELKESLKEKISERINKVKASPLRAAYALDDEPSWGHFVHPCMWQATDQPGAFEEWLCGVYGPGQAPEYEGWTTYDAVWPKLRQWSIKDFEVSQLMDQWTFNDAWYTNFLGDLVNHANRIDPETPCGMVGAQSPSPFGGYDYARLMRKIQFIEAYDLGSAQSLVRSFNPGHALPVTTTHFFHGDTDQAIWQLGYYLAHGNRGVIGWVENWFDPETHEPLPWHQGLAPHCREAGEKIGPLLAGAKWMHDGVALYYSHPSIQLGWILDAEAHGKTWRNRGQDHRLGASHLTRLAWEQMLRDEGIQYNFISYVDVIRQGIPEAYKVLVLPATLCLSEAEARAIRAFHARGGTVIADYLPGLFDQHGNAHTHGGLLDDLFQAKHSPNLKAGDLFQKTLWTEVDQDARYDYVRYEALLGTDNTCIHGPGDFHQAVREMATEIQAPRAVLMNLSPQQYLAFREKGFEAAKARAIFMQHLGLQRWVRIENADPETFGYEITYFHKEGRTILCICFNPGTVGTDQGPTKTIGLKNQSLSIRLKFSGPIEDLRDERSGKALPGQNVFKLSWNPRETLILSFSTD